MKLTRTVEQGLGRAVRGEKDYCVVLIVGPSLVKFIRGKKTRAFLSVQTNTQIQIGLDIADLAKEDIEKGSTALDVLQKLISQCLARDEGWKEYYVAEMDKVGSYKAPSGELDLFAMESEAEQHFNSGRIPSAIKTVQELIDRHCSENEDRGWYLQVMARYEFSRSKHESNALQVAAHQKNHFVLRPREGMQIEKLSMISQRRVENIRTWLNRYQDLETRRIALQEILANFRFGVRAEAFERAVNDLGIALGFQCQRPDKEWREGPDNLWALRDNEFLLIECKSEVGLDRNQINKDETGQMNNACAWFARNYTGAKVTNWLIIPTNVGTKASGFNEKVEILRESGVKRIAGNAQAFFKELFRLDSSDLLDEKVMKLLKYHTLGVEELVSEYAVEPKFAS